jgi:hypothetical protein
MPIIASTYRRVVYAIEVRGNPRIELGVGAILANDLAEIRTAFQDRTAVILEKADGSETVEDATRKTITRDEAEAKTRLADGGDVISGGRI